MGSKEPPFVSTYGRVGGGITRIVRLSTPPTTDMRKMERTPGKAVYLQLADWIREEIQSGNLAEGDVLGTHHHVAAFHHVRPDVSERALHFLRKQGWVREDREGSWSISTPRVASGVLLKWDPAGLMFDAEEEIQIQVLSKVTTTLSTELLKIFEVHGVDGTRASRVVKLHKAGELLLALETITVPVNEAPGLIMKDHRQTNIYSIIQDQYGIEIAAVEQTLHQRMLKPEEAQNLCSTPSLPALCIDRIIQAPTHAVGYVEWVIPAGRCRIRDEGFRA